MLLSELSDYEYRFWLLWRIDPQSVKYNTPLVLDLDGELDVAALQGALRDFVHHYDQGCRSSFPHRDGKPIRKVEAEVPVEIDASDAASIGITTDSDAQAWIQARCDYCFRLDQPPLFKFSLLRLPAHRHVLVLNFPHIISDAVSAGRITECLEALYNHRVAGLPGLPASLSLPASFDSLDAYNAEERAKDREYWLHMLEGSPPSIDLPGTSGATQRSEGHPVHRVIWDEQLTQQFRQQVKHHHTTIFLALSSVFAVALGRALGVDRFALSYPVNTRPPGNRWATGCYVNNVPMKVSLRSGMSIADLVAALTEERRQSKPHQRFPTAELAAALRKKTPAQQNFFNVGISEAFFTPRAQPSWAGLRVRVLPQQAGRGTLDLTLLYQDGAQLETRFDYDPERMDRSTVIGIASAMEEAVRRLIANDDMSLFAGPTYSSAYWAELQRCWHGVEKRRAPHGIVAMLTACAAEHPDRLAIQCKTGDLTYGVLHEQVSTLAGHLREAGVEPGAHVGLYLNQSARIPVGILAILASGAAFVPLDPQAPIERTKRMIDIAGVRVVLTESSHESRADLCGIQHAVLLDDEHIWRSASPAPFVECHPEQTAYVLFTSGATGQPKGAAHGHAALLNRLAWIDGVVEHPEKQRVLQKTPYTFEVSIWEILWPITRGATLVMAALLSDEGITICHFAPSMLNPFGKPIDNVSLYVLNSRLEPVPMGTQGELFIAGRAPAHGYVNAPRETAERFLPDPFASKPGQRMYATGDLARIREEGEIEYLGRRQLASEVTPAPLRGSNGIDALSPWQARVAEAWIEALKIERVQLQDHFFAMRGTSIDAMHMLGILNRITGVDVPVKTLLAHPVFADFCHHALLHAGQETTAHDGFDTWIDELTEAEVTALLGELEPRNDKESVL
jgi:non-ribosomal peptide synthetase component F